MEQDRLWLLAAILSHNPKVASAKATIATAEVQAKAERHIASPTLTLTGEYANDPATKSPWLIGGAAKMFEKISDPTVAYAVRFVLELTCDRALLRRERFLEAASALAEFDVIFPPAGGTHLSAIAKILREAPDRLPDGRWIAGFCITGNSISGYYWNREDAEAPDGRRPFDLSRDTDYFVVGDALA